MIRNFRLPTIGYVLPCLLFCLLSCVRPQKAQKQAALYATYCAGCHVAPKIEYLPKRIWEANILPEMGARLGIREAGYDPYEDLGFDERAALMEHNIYPKVPLIDEDDWKLIKDYVLSMAPDTLVPEEVPVSKELEQFESREVKVDNNSRSLFTFMQYDSLERKVLLGDTAGFLLGYDLERDTVVPRMRMPSAVVDYDRYGENRFTTAIGSLRPTALADGKVVHFVDNRPQGDMPADFHRPVHTLVEDMDDTGGPELVVSEFGDLSGSLSLLIYGRDETYIRKTLLNQPGVIRSIAKDMDGDGKKDLIVGTAQGDEGITILYQSGELEFRPRKVIRFDPVYGTSWFELIDYDGDGDDDLITAHGDNADKSYVQKPYHGIRIHLNDGSNRFEERYFFPLNGATRTVSHDFDQDGDIDFGVLSTFPDYENRPERTFVYLENIDSDNFQFTAHTLKEQNARWFLLDKGDVDQDGDMDILLSAFTFGYTPIPKDKAALWQERGVDLLILQNKLLP